MSVEIIAECSTNHGGNMAVARHFIEKFAPYVDTIKFQLTRVKHLRPNDPQYAWFERAELTLDQFAELKGLCQKCNVGFLLTVYNAADVWEVVELGCGRVKIGSGEAGERGLRDEVRARGLRPIVSCGLQNELDWGVGAMYLGCCTRYPAPAGLAVDMIWGGQLDGWSDHAEGLNELKTAIVAGAAIVETHVQLPWQARPSRAFEKDMYDMRELRQFADERPERFLGRWQHA